MRNANKVFRRNKMKMTRKCMIERRRNRLDRSINWLDGEVDRLIDIKNANPEDIQNFEVPMVIVGCDVASLYPNLKTKQAAKLVYTAIIETDMKWEQIDYT